MDVNAIKEYLSDNIDKTISLLESVGYAHITTRGDEIRCAKDEDSNPTSVVLNMETMHGAIYSENVIGDIITLIDYQLGAGFVDVLKYILSFLGLSEKDVQQRDIQLPFGGYYKKISNSKVLDFNIPPIPEATLDRYFEHPSQMFIDDGISFETQQKYRIGFDCVSGRITIPQYSIYGELVGVMGRVNSIDVDDSQAKYMPIAGIPLPRRKIVVGYHHNYASIVEKDLCIIVESDKGVMQLDSMGLPYGLGIGKHYISEHQVSAIKACRAKTIIVAMDEGLPEEQILQEAKKLQSDSVFYKNQVGYIYDRDNKYLKSGSKNSPTDLGKEVLEGLMRECVVWL